MNSNVETTSGTLDTIKLGLALLIAIAALVGFYFFADQSLLYRVLGLLAAAGVSDCYSVTDRKRQAYLGLFSRCTDRSSQSCMADTPGNSANDLDRNNYGYFGSDNFMVTGYVSRLVDWLVDGAWGLEWRRIGM